jgi:hypothetical protein
MTAHLNQSDSVDHWAKTESADSTVNEEDSDMTTPGGKVMSRCAAFAAAPLWAVQAIIWCFAPKVQEQAAPFRITRPALFLLFWLTIAAALWFSAAATTAIPHRLALSRGRLVRVGDCLAVTALTCTSLAIACIILAPFEKLQQASLTVMTATLFGGTVALAASLVLFAIACTRSDVATGPARKLPAVLAALTVATLLAIATSGASTIWGLVFAVLVVVLDGIAWLAWGRALQQPSSRPAAVALHG